MFEFVKVMSKVLLPGQGVPGTFVINFTQLSRRLITSDKGWGKCFCPCLFVCLSVCLSVSNITQKLGHGFGWNVACRQMSGHGRTD